MNPLEIAYDEDFEIIGSDDDFAFDGGDDGLNKPELSLANDCQCGEDICFGGAPCGDDEAA